MDTSLILGLLRVVSGTGEDQGLWYSGINTKQTNELSRKGGDMKGNSIFL